MENVKNLKEEKCNFEPEDNFKGVDFGTALMLMKTGEKMMREKWGDKFIVFRQGYPQGIPCNKSTAEAFGMEEGSPFICNPYLQMHNDDGTNSMYNPSNDDIFAEDWCIYLTEDEAKERGIYMSQIDWDKFKQGLAMALDAVNDDNIDCRCCPYYGLGMCDDLPIVTDSPCTITKEKINDVVDYCKNKVGRS